VSESVRSINTPFLLPEGDEPNHPTQQIWGLAVASTTSHPAHFGHIFAQKGAFFGLFVTLAARRDVTRNSRPCCKLRTRKKQAGSQAICGA
jgi:hypothetical protein